MQPLSTLERHTRTFYDWELAGRGWWSHSVNVRLEPPFRPFPGYHLESSGLDDARKPTLVSAFIERLTGRPPVTKASLPPGREDIALQLVDPAVGPVMEMEILVPSDQRIDPPAAEACLRSIAASCGQLSFELLGRNRSLAVRLAGSPEDLSTALATIREYFPDVTWRDAPPLEDHWNEAEGEVVAALEFGLAREFMVPLRVSPGVPDPLTPFVAALSQVASGEIAILQVLFEEVRAPWALHAVRATVAPDGEPFFADAPEITSFAKDKCSSPLCATAIRIALRCDTEERALHLLRSLGGALSQYGSPGLNAFIPLAGDSADALIDDILSRKTHRSGMLLSLPELASLVRLPGERIRNLALIRTPEPEEMLPAEVVRSSGTILGDARHKGATVPVRLSPEARSQHAYVIGASGTGKSTLLENLILDDIAQGSGVGVFDPHGDLVDDLLGRIPEDRIGDVVVFDPTDQEGSVGWNILGAHSALEKELLISDLVSVFRRLSTSWGDQMNVVLGNAVSAFLESSRGGTLTDLRRFLLDEGFRASFLPTVEDPHIVSFWMEEFPLLVGKRPQAPILTRLDTFLRSRLIREAVTERERPLNFRGLIDSGKIFLAKLSQGAIGEENSALLGSLLVSKFHQVGLSRQDTAVASRRPFYLYIDEFQHVATPSMAGLFSGVRKYGLSLTVAHQDLYQLHASVPEVERAVLSNAYTRVVFRVSDEDARKLERGVGTFTADTLANLARGEAICRVGAKDNAFRLRTRRLEKVSDQDSERRRKEVLKASAANYGRQGAARTATREAPIIAHPRQPGRDDELANTSVETSRLERRYDAARPAPTAGRGGPTHKYLQGLIKEWGRAEGFKAEIEQDLNGEGRVDVSLVRDSLKIACEIAGVTTVEEQIGNIQKCLDHGFHNVVAVSLDAAFLRKLRKALPDRIDPAHLDHVSLLSPEEVLTFLQAQANPQKEARVAGYAVRVRHHRGDGTDHTEKRRRAIAEVMLRSVKRMRENEQ